MKLEITMVVAALLGACQPPAAARGTTPASRSAEPAAPLVAALEARIARLETVYAQNAQALAFLGKVYAQQAAQQAAEDREAPAEDAMFAVDITADVRAGQVDGPAGAAVTIVKAFDFACPYCAQTAATMDELVKDYAGKVRVVYMNLVIHATARPAHLASCAAAKQGKYSQFKRAFWDKGFAVYAESRDATKLAGDHLLAIARGVGLDVARLKTDMESQACAARLEQDMAELAKFHVNATPTFFVNGKLLVGGAMAKAGFRQVIDEELAIVGASGVPAADYYAKVVLARGEKQFRSKLDPKP
jgi:protein-disulfide isomerase